MSACAKRFNHGGILFNLNPHSLVRWLRPIDGRWAWCRPQLQTWATFRPISSKMRRMRAEIRVNGSTGARMAVPSVSRPALRYCTCRRVSCSTRPNISSPSQQAFTSRASSSVSDCKPASERLPVPSILRPAFLRCENRNPTYPSPRKKPPQMDDLPGSLGLTQKSKPEQEPDSRC